MKQWFFTESNDQNFKITYACIDIRDVAVAHVMALRKEAAGSERLIHSEGMHDPPPSPVCIILDPCHKIRHANLARHQIYPSQLSRPNIERARVMTDDCNDRRATAFSVYTKIPPIQIMESAR